MNPYLIEGGSFFDERGKVRFVNKFDLTLVKRMYIVEHSSSEVVRAWQAHKVEQKWFFVLDGKFRICAVKLDDWNSPSDDLEVLTYELDSSSEQVLFIPNGYANGIKALENDSRLLVFSDLDLVSAKNDDYRFDKEKWVNWNF